MALQPGLHDLRLEYTQIAPSGGYGGAVLQAGVGGAKAAPVDPATLFHMTVRALGAIKA